jgi:hypothetical protein
MFLPINKEVKEIIEFIDIWNYYNILHNVL